VLALIMPLSGRDPPFPGHTGFHKRLGAFFRALTGTKAETVERAEYPAHA